MVTASLSVWLTWSDFPEIEEGTPEEKKKNRPEALPRDGKKILGDGGKVRVD